MKNNDPTLDRIREARLKISARYGHDIKKYVDHYAKLEHELESVKKHNPKIRPRDLIFDEKLP